MMYQVIFLCISLISVRGEHDVSVETLEDTKEQSENGYHFKFATSDEQEREETGVFDKIGENLILRITGFYSYRGDDGKLYRVNYQADDDGYKPQGASISTSDENGLNIKSVKIQTRLKSKTRIATSAIASLAGGGIG